MTNKTILIIEDEAALRKILSDVLTREGFSVLTAPNGREGVLIAKESHPDLILLDLLMPEMNGMDALKKIRADAWGAKVPVIILTNLNADSEDTVKDMVEGRPLFYLIKSDWKIADVVTKVKEVLLQTQ